jgi:Fur family transcriptional regulator, ferric uptake regulator
MIRETAASAAPAASVLDGGGRNAIMGTGPCGRFRERIRVSQRNTDQRQAIREVFTQSDRPLSTDEVLRAAQTHKPGLGIATVYRTIKLLIDEGWLATVKLPGEPPRYEMAGKPHHHHFYCNQCGRVFEVPGKAELLEAVVPDGFMLESHDLVLYGRCPPCTQAAS